VSIFCQTDEWSTELLEECKPLFGISSRPLRDLLENELLPPLWAAREHELRDKLDELGENSKCVAYRLFSETYDNFVKHGKVSV
jgi:hypothetical protein